MAGISQSPEVNWARWYGHWRPQDVHAVLRSDSVSTLGHKLTAPIANRSQVLGVMGSFAELSPTFARAASRFGRGQGHAKIVLADIPMPVTGFDLSGPEVILPTGQPVGRYLDNFIRTVGTVLPPPDGLAFPPQELRGSHAQIVAGLWQHQAWSNALAETFLLQVVHELRQAGFEHHTSGRITGLADTHSLTYLIRLRQSGLAGMAMLYPEMLDPSMRSILNHHFTRQAEDRIRGADDMVEEPWQPDALGDKPFLPETDLDREAQAIHRFGAGLYTGVNRADPLPAAEVAEIARALDQPISGPADIDLVIGLIERIAPRFAPILLRPYRDGRVRVVVESPGPNGHTKTGTDLATLLGITMTEIQHVGLRQGQSIRESLPILVRNLSCALAPPTLQEGAYRPRLTGRREDVTAVVDFLEHAMARQDGWGCTGKFQFIEEARQRGIAFELNETEQAMLRILKVGGYAVIAERFFSFMSGELRARRRSQIASAALAVIADYSDYFSTVAGS